MEYLLHIMTALDCNIVNKKLFYKQIGFDLQSGDIIRLKKYNQLYHTVSVRSRSEITQRLVLERLVNELHIIELVNQLKIFLSKFSINIHTAFNYCTAKLELLEFSTDTDLLKEFAQCEYKLVNCSHKQTKEHVVFFEYDNEIIINKLTSYEIHFCNGFNKWILFQQIDKQDFDDKKSSNKVYQNMELFSDKISFTTVKDIQPNTLIEFQLQTARYLLRYSDQLYGCKKNNIPYQFPAIKSFQIDLPKESGNYIKPYCLLVSPHKHVKFTLFKTFYRRKYFFLNALEIDTEIDFAEWNYNSGGGIQIFCEKDVIINTNGFINGNGKGYTNEIAEYDDYKGCLNYGYTDNMNNPKSRGGGIIEIISQSVVTNFGIISTKGVHQGKGGSISIKCKSFVNFGTVECSETQTGSIHIVCCEFMNEGSIVPEPNTNIINHMNQINTDFTEIQLAPQGHEQRIKLKVWKHNGHYSNYHPHNLLNDEKRYSNYYLSKDLGSNLANDFIVFQIVDDKVYHITKIKIKNDQHNWGIKNICLYMGSSRKSGETKWIKLQKENITNIKKGSGIWMEDEQYFDVQPTNEIYGKRLDLIKVEILDNYGDSYNQFYEFSCYGRGVYRS
eukprot:543096_1